MPYWTGRKILIPTGLLQTKNFNNNYQKKIFGNEENFLWNWWLKNVIPRSHLVCLLKVISILSVQKPFLLKNYLQFQDLKNSYLCSWLQKYSIFFTPKLASPSIWAHAWLSCNFVPQNMHTTVSVSKSSSLISVKGYNRITISVI